jgi:hypothetical protein
VSSRSIVGMAAAALLLAGCVQDFSCPYFCGTSETPVGGVTVSGEDVDSVNAKCEKDHASSCAAADAGPVRCDCRANEDLSPGTNTPGSPRVNASDLDNAFRTGPDDPHGLVMR